MTTRYFLPILVFLVGVAPTYAQLSSAKVTGIVHDSSAAVIADATIILRNVGTSVERRTRSNSTGNYAFINVPPGPYVLEASAAGFKTAALAPFTLTVNRELAADLTLEVGSLEQTVTVEAQAAQIQSATAELGTVVAEKQVADLPLNGRNFTQLLSLTPGVAPISVGQNRGGDMTPVTAGSSFTFPSVNGQTNRSNYFMVDGINDNSAQRNTYAVPPIIDAIQEFKVNSHNDEAQFGAVMGGVVNVVTKSGTNDLHGSLWEFLRNDFFNARNTFLPSVSPFKQNQFGGALGAPLWIPKLYNGKNKTFFFIAAEGFLYRQPVNSTYIFQTPANLAGDLSNFSNQIFNPFSTRLDPSTPGQFIRDPFSGNQIPSSLIDQRAVAYAKVLFPGPFILLPGTTTTGINTTPLVQDQENYTGRIDQNFGTRDYLWFRYSGLQLNQNQPVYVPGFKQSLDFPAQNYGVSWVHIFSPTLILQAQFGRSHAESNSLSRFQGNRSGLNAIYGFNSNFGGNFIDGVTLAPIITVASFWSAGEVDGLYPDITNIHQYKSNISKVVGKHTVQFGGEWAQSIMGSTGRFANVGFATAQTGNPKNSSQVGNALASYLLNVPDSANRNNVIVRMRPGGVMSFHVQDQWKALSRLTINVGLRYDRTFIPPYGTEATIGLHGGIEAGNINFNDGTYVLQRVPPACSQRGFAPCIPGDGTLPAHVVVDPRGKIFHDTTKNFGPRLGLAYRLGARTAIRAGFGIVYDNWAAVTQMAQSLKGAWPDIGSVAVSNLNYPTSSNPAPTVQGQNPMQTANEFPSATPFNQVIYFADPYQKNPYSEQWNFGIQHQFSGNTMMSLTYVGSGSHRLDVGGYYNTALTPGPGTPSARAPYPYIRATNYDRSIGNGNYNALQFQVERRFASGLGYQVAYTFAKAIDAGASGWFGVEGQSLVSG